MRNQREPRVLLAEDDAAMRAMVARALRRDGFEVIEARNGYETLERLAYALVTQPRKKVDLIISDVRMPGYDGINILVSIRGVSLQVPVILITAFGTADTHATARRLGAYALLDKPFDVEDLLQLSRAAIAANAGDEEAQS
jgi:DNA-binding NtrC family response regulator